MQDKFRVTRTALQNPYPSTPPNRDQSPSDLHQSRTSDPSSTDADFQSSSSTHYQEDSSAQATYYGYPDSGEPTASFQHGDFYQHSRSLPPATNFPYQGPSYDAPQFFSAEGFGASQDFSQYGYQQSLGEPHPMGFQQDSNVFQPAYYGTSSQAPAFQSPESYPNPPFMDPSYPHPSTSTSYDASGPYPTSFQSHYQATSSSGPLTHGNHQSRSNTPVAPTNVSGSSKSAKVCSNCGATSTPMWRRAPQTGAFLCNACGLYLQARNKPRPPDTRRHPALRRYLDSEFIHENPGGSKQGNATGSGSGASGMRCSRCGARSSSAWSRGDDGSLLCRGCGGYAS